MKGKVLLIGALALMIAPLTAGAAGFEPGLFQAKLNVNVRSSAAFGRNLINHFGKGELVEVIAVKGKWCQVKAERRSFVYCDNLSRIALVVPTENKTNIMVTGSMINKPNLGNGAEGLNGDLGTTTKPLELQTVSTYNPTPANPNEVLAVSNLRNFQEYLRSNNERGKNYINLSLDKGMTAALNWASDAYLVKFEAQFPLNGKDAEANCSFTWASKNKSTELLKTLCLSSSEASEATKMTLLSDATLAGNGSVIPELKMSDLVDQMLMNVEMVKKLNSAFATAPVAETKWSFVLSNVAAGNPVWNMRVLDGAGNVKFSAKSSAASATAGFTY